MPESFTFWWSAISTVIGVALLCVTLWQTKATRDEKKRNTSQVKIWMQDANGISLAMQRVIQDNLGGRYTSTNDMANTIFALQSTAFALYQSLYEERCVTEEEFKDQQRKFKEEFEKSRQIIVPTEVNLSNNASDKKTVSKIAETKIKK
ncbi:hypothetical protein A2215_03140 [Candidatus Berkelbacteria bacterium RIFOXYA2_FULL_43_10]|uniref:Uncharacterized protein n=1 Tax=Candidatus Berkelbacteria bacterium RIFOXYA2_FULL_43_10 TaxID=1797472 RepID=A0A1F5EED3_9BACT|nr:MAG: hypothetical protein A2215_03140 [Candidatus Berkelbacteria bacterium RIFOXYA2_FULL_43_10]